MSRLSSLPVPGEVAMVHTPRGTRQVRKAPSTGAWAQDEMLVQEASDGRPAPKPRLLSENARRVKRLMYLAPYA